MKKRLLTLSLLLVVGTLTSCNDSSSSSSSSSSNEEQKNTSLILNYDFEDTSGNKTVETVSGEESIINYVFSDETNINNIFKEPSDPLLKEGVNGGNSLYLDGFSTSITNHDFTTPLNKVTFSSWVAPRVFENLWGYADDNPESPLGHPALTAIYNKGDICLTEGFVFGYSRLGLWGIQLALHSNESEEDFVVGYYDPLNALPLYEWSHIVASFDGETGYIMLAFNGKVAYEAIIPELANTELIDSSEPLYIGKYIAPHYEFGVPRQRPSGLLDELSIYDESLSPKEINELYLSYTYDGVHPSLKWSEVALDSSVYAGDRYRPQYHALPPAVWMNEPHSPFYYKGRYHVFYQHNPSGPYWSQIRWGHLVSDDMVHWKYVKDAVVPTKGICPEGIWTGGAVIGPDGTPWLAITAGTNTTTWTGQNIAFAHAVDPDDPDLTDWVVEDVCVITQPSDNSQGEREQFRDPFVWEDDGIYYMMVSTSIPNAGGSACIYTSTNMREWEYKGYVFECDYNLYPEQGAHWECVVMLPISTKDGRATKYIMFDCPQYTVDGYTVECYYWIGTFDKEACRFIPDDPKPRLFDGGVGIYTGQNGYCYLTEEDKANGKTAYEDGRTIIYAIAQGKDAGTAQNINAGWAHNFAIPLELHLADNLNDVIREPIKEIESLYEETLYEHQGNELSSSDLNEAIKNIRGDTLRIDAKIKINATGNYSSAIGVRYNPTTTSEGETEYTKIVFDERGVWIDRTYSSSLDYVNKKESHLYANPQKEYDVTILLDRSMLEVYINGVFSFTTRIYPKYGDSDYLHIFDDNNNLVFEEFKVIKMGSAYSDELVPAYYGNTGNLKDKGE